LSSGRAVVVILENPAADRWLNKTLVKGKNRKLTMSFEPQFNRLRIYNIFMGCLHLA
jgi:hypothetical protein